MAEKFSEFIPLSERAVRRDGTISLKIIQPGWGASGYYPREVLERDIPKVFPKGTHQYWNHQTPTEEMERPEGDLRDLAAVTISDPIWLDNGPKGPGMYAESKVFAGYAGVIDEIGEHIGVSIRGMGRHTTGEAEGKNGRIIQEIAAGKSVDFVTVPGAGGGIVSIFESAPNAGKLSDPTTPNDIDEFLSEAGRVLSKANETKLKAALEQLTAVLSLLNSEETNESFKRLAEARNIGEWLESRLHLHLTMVGDEMYGDGRVSREERKAMSSAVGAALDAYRTDLMSNAPQLFKRDTWAKSPESEDIAAMGGMMQESEDNAMSEQELKEARAALKTVEEAKATAEAELAKAREQLLFREAGDFVSSQLAEAELPDVTKARLQKALAANPPVKEGALDKDAFKAKVETAVTEARTEIAALLGKDGRVTGNGENASGDNAEQPTLEAARTRLDKSLASIGYGGSNGN